MHFAPSRIGTTGKRTMLSRMRGAALSLFFGLVLGACDRSTATAPAPSASAPAAAPASASPLPEREVSGEAAFDLVATEEGAALLWGRPASEGSELVAAVLDSGGVARGEPIVLSVPASERSSRVVQVESVSVQGRLGVAWVTTDGQRALTHAALGDAKTRSFTPGAALGETALDDPRQRGQTAITASDRGEFLVLRRGSDERCSEDPSQRCATFAFREVLSTGPEPRGLPLSVPAPCPRAIVGFTVIQDRWHYALCSLAEGRPVTTLFNVQRTPFYAEAKRLHDGCTPLGVSAVNGDAVTVADCSDGRRGTLSAGLERPAASVELSQATLECELGRPVLRAPGERVLALSFDRPLSGLGPLVPARVAPASARVVWTGTTLLGAIWSRGRVALHRWQCRGSELARAD